MEIINNFVVFEGGDGSGTTTQLSLLKDRFENALESVPAAKFPVFFPTFEPTDNHTGKIIRSALKNEITFLPETLCFLFASDRNEHLHKKNGIIDRCGKGELVVSDRYVLSSLVYQGIECGDELPNALNSRFPAPEITIFFDIEPETALERLKNRKTVELYEYLDFQKNVRKRYHSAIAQYRKFARVEVIDASKNALEIADQVWSLISELPIFK